MCARVRSIRIGLTALLQAFVPVLEILNLFFGLNLVDSVTFLEFACQAVPLSARPLKVVSCQFAPMLEDVIGIDLPVTFEYVLGHLSPPVGYRAGRCPNGRVSVLVGAGGRVGCLCREMHRGMWTVGRYCSYGRQEFRRLLQRLDWGFA